MPSSSGGTREVPRTGMRNFPHREGKALGPVLKNLYGWRTSSWVAFVIV